MNPKQPHQSPSEFSPAKHTLSSAFERQVKIALKHYRTPNELAQHSSLASHYFLADVSSESPSNNVIPDSSAATLGQQLQREIYAAACQLWGSDIPVSTAEFRSALQVERGRPGTKRYAFLVLELRCFRTFVKVRRLADIWEDIDLLPSSRSEHYRDYDAAIAELAPILLQRLRPTFRLEHPPLSSELIGYSAFEKQGSTALKNRQTLSISGPSGVGKTSLGARLASYYPVKQVFWYTIRPQLNDHLQSLLYTLGYFLHLHGASNLWKLLLVHGDSDETLHIALNVVREDLDQLHKFDILLCFDEIDLLKTEGAENGVPERKQHQHSQLIRFIEGLRGAAALMLIGQRPILEADVYLEPTGLTVPQITELMANAHCDVDQAAAVRLFHFTNGNPRLLDLVVALLRNKTSLEDLFTTFGDMPELTALLYRLWPRLSAEERRCLQLLSVFRGVVPDEPWQNEPGVLEQLRRMRLIRHDGIGGNTLLPALKTVIYRELTTELREELHIRAAQIRSVYGEYTAAAYHFWKGSEEAKAIQVWFPHRLAELQRGQGENILTIFGQISRNRLRKKERQALDLIRAELSQLKGDAERGLAHLAEEDWSEASELAVYAKRLNGEFLESLGYPSQAQDTYESALNLNMRLQRQVVNLHHRLGMLHIRQRRSSEAQREVQIAQYETQHLTGMYQEEVGKYDEAYIAYAHGLALAQTMEDNKLTAQSHRLLSRFFGKQSKYDEALNHANQAINHFNDIGDRLSEEIVRRDLVALYLNTLQFDEAIRLGKEVLIFFRNIGDTLSIATTAVNLAESYYNKGEYLDAEQYAHEALALEEPYTVPYALYTLGLIQQAKYKLDAALELMCRCLSQVQAQNDIYMEAYVQKALMDIYHQQDNVDLTQRAGERAVELFQEMKVPTQVEELEARLRDIIA